MEAEQSVDRLRLERESFTYWNSIRERRKKCVGLIRRKSKALAVMIDFSRVTCVAFDCFGTVFDMTPIPRHEIAAYVEHVRRDDFEPYEFPYLWGDIKAHPDSCNGISLIQDTGLTCVALSNGSWDLIRLLAARNYIEFDKIIDLVKHRVYKPHVEAYRTIEKDLGIAPENTLMVTANPTFGDIEGAAAVGMQSIVIRQPGECRDIMELAERIERGRTC
jgi:FMN phosphatase YigB (HAD superfamily)